MAWWGSNDVLTLPNMISYDKQSYSIVLQVIDEADRVMGEIKQDWLLQVESAVFRKNSHRPTPGPLTAARFVIPVCVQ